MELTIAGHTFKTYKQIDIYLRYDSVASRFDALLYFDPTNSTHREIFSPGKFRSCTITHGGVTLLTGMVLNYSFLSAAEPPRSLVSVSGYSKTGVLQDCVPVTDILQRTGVGFADYVNELCDHYAKLYNFKVIIDPEVADVANTQLLQVNAEPDMKIADLLNNIATHLNLILSHDRFGNLVITNVKTDKLLTTSASYIQNTSFTTELAGAPDSIQTTTTAKDRSTLYDFSKPGTYTGMRLVFAGQMMYSDVVVNGEYDTRGNGNGIESAPLSNPFVSTPDYKTAFDQSTPDNNRGSRPYTFVQRSQTAEVDNAAPRTARSIIGDCLKNIILTIDVKSWTLNGHMITPNQMVTAKNEELALYKTARWFIQGVDLHGDELLETAKIICVPPSAYGTDPVVNDIFS